MLANIWFEEKVNFKPGLKLSSPQSEQNSLTFPDPQQNSLTFQKKFIFPDFPGCWEPWYECVHHIIRGDSLHGSLNVSPTEATFSEYQDWFKDMCYVWAKKQQKMSISWTFCPIILLIHILSNIWTPFFGQRVHEETAVTLEKCPLVEELKLRTWRSTIFSYFQFQPRH